MRKEIIFELPLELNRRATIIQAIPSSWSWSGGYLQTTEAMAKAGSIIATGKFEKNGQLALETHRPLSTIPMQKLRPMLSSFVSAGCVGSLLFHKNGTRDGRPVAACSISLLSGLLPFERVKVTGPPRMRLAWEKDDDIYNLWKVCDDLHLREYVFDLSSETDDSDPGMAGI